MQTSSDLQNISAPKSYVFKVGTNDLRDIISILNRKPFDENFTMVTFDELSGKDRLLLLQRIFKKINPDSEINFEENNEDNKALLTDTLSIYSFPDMDENSFVESIFKGEKIQIDRLIYFCLMNFQDLQERAYLGNFLAPIDIPAEYLMDDEMKNLQMSLLEYQNIFKEEHQKLATVKAQIPKSKEYAQKISQLENEKDQLKIRINSFQERIDLKDANKVAQMKELIQAAKLLRLEQEEEMNLMEKYREQRENLEISENKLLQAKQKLLDTEKLYGQSTTALEMLNLERQKNETLKKEISDKQFELKEKLKIFSQNEAILSEPIPSKEVIAKTEAQIASLSNLIADKEKQLIAQADPTKEEKLSIFRQQVKFIERKKEEIILEEQKLEKQRGINEALIIEKTKELEKLKGPNYYNKSDFDKFQEDIEQKTISQQKKQAELADIEREITILKQTEDILKLKLCESYKEVKKYEQKHGLGGLAVSQQDFEELPLYKDQYEHLKDKSNSELTNILEEVKTKVESEKEKLKPMVEEHKNLKLKVKELDDQYIKVKGEYDKETGHLTEKYMQLEEDYKEKSSAAYKLKLNCDIFFEKTRALTKMNELLEHEEKCQNGLSKFNDTFKTYADKLTYELSQNEEKLKLLKKQRDNIKDNSIEISEKHKSLDNLHLILTEKLNSRINKLGKTIPVGAVREQYNRVMID